MNTRIYAIYDKVAKDHGPLFEAPNDEVAFRMIRRIKELTEAPDEYRLDLFGAFNRSEQLSKIELLPSPEEVYFTMPPKSNVTNKEATNV